MTIEPKSTRSTRIEAMKLPVPKSTRSTRRMLKSSNQNGDKSDTVAKSAQTQNDNVAKSERDEASEAKTGAVAENKNSEVPLVCDSKADVEQATEAPQQRQQHQLSSATVCAPDHDAAQCVQQRTAEQVIDVPDDAGTSAQQRTVEQVVKVADETTAVNQLDQEPLDETHRVEMRAKAAPSPRGLAHTSRATRAGASPVRGRSQAPLQARQSTDSERQTENSLMMLWLRPRRPCAEGIGRTAGSPVRWLNALIRPAVTYATPCPVVEYIAPVSAAHAATVPVNEYATPVPFICHRGR